jgi:hypothetical protein
MTPVIAIRLTRLVTLLAVVLVSAAAASAQDPGCKLLADAVVLQARTPSHIFTTMTGSTGNISTETITTKDALYLRSPGAGGNQWKKSAYSPQEQAEQAVEASRSYTSCQHVGDESVNGEPAAVYTEVNKDSGLSGKAWISKKRGLPLKSELALDNRRFSTRYDYDNVRPPANAQ